MLAPPLSLSVPLPFNRASAFALGVIIVALFLSGWLNERVGLLPHGKTRTASLLILFDSKRKEFFIGFAVPISFFLYAIQTVELPVI